MDQNAHPGAKYDEDLHDITTAAAAAEAEIAGTGMADRAERATEKQENKDKANQQGGNRKAETEHKTQAQPQAQDGNESGGYDVDLYDITSAAAAAEREIVGGNKRS